MRKTLSCLIPLFGGGSRRNMNLHQRIVTMTKRGRSARSLWDEGVFGSF
jgi:hypothetical protein